MLSEKLGVIHICYESIGVLFGGLSPGCKLNRPVVQISLTALRTDTDLKNHMHQAVNVGSFTGWSLLL